MSLVWTDADGAYPAIVDGRAHGAIRHRAFAPEEVAAAVDRLAAARFVRSELLPGPENAGSHGLMLAPTAAHPRGPGFEQYLDAAARNEPELDRVLPGLRARVAGLLAAAAGRPARVPAAPDGRSYATATIREVPPGRELPLHNDTYQPSPAWAHLDGLRDRTTRVSWYVVLAAPEAGGVLEIVPPGARLEYGMDVGGEPVELGPGDLVLFDAGRLFHRVTAPRGSRRLTLGGFSSFSADRQEVLFWG